MRNKLEWKETSYGAIASAQVFSSDFTFTVFNTLMASCEVDGEVLCQCLGRDIDELKHSIVSLAIIAIEARASELRTIAGLEER